jgi:phage shock protein PspC (stress-responsive transcriptional regulator)
VEFTVSDITLVFFTGLIAGLASYFEAHFRRLRATVLAAALAALSTVLLFRP